MKLHDFRWLADQNINAQLAAFMRTIGFDLVGVHEVGLLGKSDTTILNWASTEGRIVLTHDADFGKLVLQAGTPFIGIVYLRPGHKIASDDIDSLQQLIDIDPELHPPFIVVLKRKDDAVNIRIRQISP